MYPWSSFLELTIALIIGYSSSAQENALIIIGRYVNLAPLFASRNFALIFLIFYIEKSSWILNIGISLASVIVLVIAFLTPTIFTTLSYLLG